MADIRVSDVKQMTDTELDSWLAEHVMGWWWGDERRFERADYDCILFSPQHPRYLPEFILDQPLEHPHYLSGMPRFSSDPAASAQLRQRMIELGWSFKLSRLFPSGSSSAEFYCNFGPCERHGNPYSNWHGVEAESANECRAVAEAAFAALEGK